MGVKFAKGTYAYVEINSPLNHRDIGVIEYKNKIYIRRFIVRRDKLVLRPENNDYEEISIFEGDDFTIVGKVIGTDKGLIL